MLSALFRHDLVLRAAGLVVLTGAALCLSRLFGDGTAIAGHAGLRQVAEATVGFLGCCGGAALALLGHHIHDRIALSARWTHRD